MARAGVVAEGRVARSVARRRWAWSLGLVLVLVMGSVLVTALPRLALATPHKAMSIGVDDGQMQAAVNAAGWPQQGDNWCGIATVAAIANFLGDHVSQGAVTAFLNSSSAVSGWGTPSWNGIGPGFAADIARDSGSDPRALAEGMRQFGGAWYSQMVDLWGSWDATGQLAADLEHDHQPISVIVDGGQHSVVVSKIYANGDPAWNPGAITALEVWDPGFGTSAGLLWAQSVTVSLGTWLGDGRLWGSVYNDYLDPDPAVGPYTYDPSIGNYNHLWTGHFVYIRPGGIPGVSVDWAINQNWVVIAGQHGELPPGYHFPPTPTPVPTATPTNAPTRAARLAPTSIPTPLPTATATAVPEPTATATPVPALALTAQSLCVGSTCLETSFVPWWAVAGLALLLTLAVLSLVFLGLRRRAHHRHPPDGPSPPSTPEPVTAGAPSAAHS
jgi:hypothetical protein